MKLDQIDRSRNFSKRLLNDFTNALFDLLQEKGLETITIGELCDKIKYPRSTFYNYFEDIYALMDYCWETVCNEAKIYDTQDIEHNEKTFVLFNRIYDYIECNRDAIDMLLKHNSAGCSMMLSLDSFIRKTIYKMIADCPFSYKYPVPKELIAQHYSNTIQMILSACFLDKSIAKNDAISYIDFLLGTLERESTQK